MRPALLALVALGCSAPTVPKRPVQLTVFAASSLTEVFGDLERGFEAANPDVDVRLSFAGSQVLRLQIEHGAPADLFASADDGHVRALVEAGHATDGGPFAGNELVVVVPPDNPAGIERFGDLPKASRVVVGNAHVPVGVYARSVLDRAGPEFAAAVGERIVSEESNARLVRAKVELGEADAALVYRTDAAASGRVRVVPIPDALNARARYLLATVTRPERSPAAGRFAAYVRSAEGRATLHRHGFLTGSP